MVSIIELVSPLPLDECESRLREAADREGLLSWFGSKPIVGRVSARYIRLRQRIGYRNSFQTFLIGSLEDCDGGTLFRGRAGMHPLVKGFMAVWFSGVVLFGGIAFVTSIQGMLAGGGQPIGAIIPAAMLAFGVVLVGVGRWLARDEERFLVSFLAGVIGAPETKAEPSAHDGDKVT